MNQFQIMHLGGELLWRVCLIPYLRKSWSNSFLEVVTSTSLAFYKSKDIPLSKMLWRKLRSLNKLRYKRERLIWRRITIKRTIIVVVPLILLHHLRLKSCMWHMWLIKLNLLYNLIHHHVREIINRGINIPHRIITISRIKIKIIIIKIREIIKIDLLYHLLNNNSNKIGPL